MQLSERILAIPLFYKVLGANVAIVLIGAIAGTYVTAQAASNDALMTRPLLILLFAALGGGLSVAVNVLVLRAAFAPLDTLERLSDAVRSGDLSARVVPSSRFDPQLARLAETFNDTLDELERDRTELRELASQVIRAQEDERMRIARELHDDTAQVLFAQLLAVTSLKGSPNPDLRATAESLENMTVDAIESVRRLALELRPPALDDLGLREALADLAQRFSEQLSIPVQFQWSGSRDRLQPSIELVLYRIAQEALTNSAKYAQATAIRVSLRRTPGHVELTIDDNGRGFARGVTPGRDQRGLGLGLFGMEERAGLVGGNFTIRQLNPQGVRIQATIPLAEPAPELALGTQER